MQSINEIDLNTAIHLPTSVNARNLWVACIDSPAAVELLLKRHSNAKATAAILATNRKAGMH